MVRQTRRAHRLPPRGHPLRACGAVAARSQPRGAGDLLAHGLANRLRPVGAAEARRVCRLAAPPRRRLHARPGDRTAGEAGPRAAARTASNAACASTRARRCVSAAPRGAADRRDSRRPRARRAGRPHHGAWAAGSRSTAAPLPCVDFMVVTEPVPDLLAEIGWTTHSGLADSRRDALLPAAHRRRPHRHRWRRHGHGLRRRHRRASARLAAPRGAGGPRPGLALSAARGGALRACLERTHGPHQVGVCRSSPRCRTATCTRDSASPVTASRRPRVGGKILASLALGADDEWVRLPVVGPPCRCRPNRCAGPW